MRHYPEDARRRKRTGTVIITFSVNERGEVLQSQLANSSGTHSLDRAALMALENARPLPPPPKELLRNGINKVTLPVEFGLLKKYKTRGSLLFIQASRMLFITVTDR